MKELLYKEEAFQLVGCCMEIHRELGKGHDEVIYKDAFVKIRAIRVKSDYRPRAFNTRARVRAATLSSGLIRSADRQCASARAKSPFCKYTRPRLPSAS